jgi:chemotaxis protein CheD
MEKAHIYLGDIFVSPRPFLIETLLGSCVAVCIYDKKKQYGGMNHFFLPSYNGNGAGLPFAKYGKNATQKLIGLMLVYGSKLSDLTARIYGGADLFYHNLNPFKVGQKNIEIAYETLKKFRVKIEEGDTGGKTGRKIWFDNQLGYVSVKYVKNFTENPEILRN